MPTIITLKEWRNNNPYREQFQSDIYYTKLSNRIVKILEKSSLNTSLPRKESLKVAAMTIARWFEDICTGIGFWHTVNIECQRRYGKPVPFYDTKDYIMGEPNIQDIQLLLWDFLSVLYDDEMVNPMNPGIMRTSVDIFNLIDKEWETADSTDELLDFISDPLVGTNYWATRDVLEWISMSTYINTNGIKLYLRDLYKLQEENYDSEHLDIYSYSRKWEHIFMDRHNLLSFTSSEWLSSICDRDIDINTDLFKQRIYTILNYTPTALMLKDCVNGKVVNVNPDSIEESWLDSEQCRPGEVICCALVQIKGVYNLCGMMLSAEDPAFSEPVNEQNRFLDKLKDSNHILADKFYKASNGKHIIFINGEKELDRLLRGLDFDLDHPEIKKMKDGLYEHNNKMQIAAVWSPGLGVQYITRHIAAIKSADNKLYNEDYGNEHAHVFICNTNIINHHNARMLVREGMLPDASFVNHIDARQGRETLQQNAEFLVDYYFSEHE